MGRFLRRLAMLWRGGRFDRELQEEMRLHVELRRQQHLDRGLSAEAARTAAERQFGNATLLGERSGDAWGWRGLENFAQDLRYGARSLARSPGFTAVAVIALALGIGANTAIFSVVNAVLLRPLAYRDAGRLVTLLHFGTAPVAAANYLDWRDQSHSFETMAAADYWTSNLTGRGNPEHIPGLKVTANLLPMLGIAPMLGRLFLANEDQSRPGAGDYRRRNGFRSAAVLLLEEAARARMWNDRDPLIWPALYNFRHYVELELKYLIREFQELDLGVPLATHRLRKLWPPVAKGFARCFGNEDREPFDVLERAIAMLEALDPAGDGFRYATTRRGESSMIEDVYLDPQALLRLIREVEEVLGAAGMAFQAEAEVIQEMLELRYDF